MSEEIIIIPEKKIAFSVETEKAGKAADNTQSIADFLGALSNVGSVSTGSEDAPGSIAGTPSSFVKGTQNSIAENTDIKKQPVIYTALPSNTGNATNTNATQTKPSTTIKKSKKHTNWFMLLIIIVLFILIIRGISK